MSQEVIEGWRGVMVAAGLGAPMSRALTAAMLTGVVSYSMKLPRRAFRSDGSLRPSVHTGSYAPDDTDMHFLLTPLAVGTAVYLFT